MFREIILYFRPLRPSLIASIKHPRARARRPPKLLLHSPHAHKPTQQRRTPRLIVCPARPRAPKRLLPDHRAGTFTVDIEIPGRVPERVFGEADGGAVFGEDGAGEGVVGCGVDGAADFGEGGLGVGLIGWGGVDVDAEDGAEELGAEEGVVRVLGLVDGWVDEVAVGIVVVSADKKLELRVILGVIDDFCEFGEGGFVDDGADEVGKGLRVADFEGFGFGDQLGFEGGPERGRDVGAGRGAAFLALVFEGAANGVDDGIVDVCGRMDEVVVFATRFANDARVASIFAFCDAGGDFAVEAAEDGGAAGVVEGGEVAMREDDVRDADGVTGDELDDIGGETGFHEDFVDEVVGGNC